MAATSSPSRMRLPYGSYRTSDSIVRYIPSALRQQSGHKASYCPEMHHSWWRPPPGGSVPTRGLYAVVGDSPHRRGAAPRTGGALVSALAGRRSPHWRSVGLRTGGAPLPALAERWSPHWRGAGPRNGEAPGSPAPLMAEIPAPAGRLPESRPPTMFGIPAPAERGCRDLVPPPRPRSRQPQGTPSAPHV